MATVRRLSEADAADFRAIRLEALQRHPEAFAATYADEAAQPLAFFSGRLKSGAVFGGFQGPALLGIAGFYTLAQEKVRHKGVLYGMYVKESARGTGLAGQLVDAVLAHARQEVELVQLSVVASNDAARRLYERRGFERYGVEPRALKVDGRYLDEALMVKRLV